jgi:hypothetical protein
LGEKKHNFTPFFVLHKKWINKHKKHRKYIKLPEVPGVRNNIYLSFAAQTTNNKTTG